MCGMSRSMWYGYLACKKKREERAEHRKRNDEKIMANMRAVLKSFHGVVPGARTFRLFLWRNFETHVSRKKISQLMKKMNITATMRQKDAYKGQAKHDHPCTAPENPVNQNFNVGPRKIICTDVTYIILRELRITIYMCVFKDACTKEILGHACGRTMDTGLIKEAYHHMMAEHGNSFTGDTRALVHSDQGTQYLSTTFKQLLENDHLIQSVSARGNSQDNAPAESFFAKFKTEIMRQLELCTSYEMAVQMIDGYMDDYNNSQYQYNLGGLTPHEYYLYRETGIYPCDSYYGQKATNVKSLEDMVNDSLKKQHEKREAHKLKLYERRRRWDLLSKDPLLMNLDDQKILENWIKKIEEKRDEFSREAERLKKVLNKAKQAQSFMELLTLEERYESFGKPQDWQGVPELSYIYDMDGLFN